jgi:hypothetical protein
MMPMYNLLSVGVIITGSIMPALDSCEAQVLRALQKLGWIIHRKPLILDTHERRVYADFSLQKRTNGTQNQIIVVEVKCFVDPKYDLIEFYNAVGQYLFYRTLLSSNELPFAIYIAIPENVYS